MPAGYTRAQRLRMRVLFEVAHVFLDARSAGAVGGRGIHPPWSAITQACSAVAMHWVRSHSAIWRHWRGAGPAMWNEAERVASLALTLAGVPASAQPEIIERLCRRLDRAEAMARRDTAIREAHRLVGSPRKLTQGLHDFYARAWPYQRHLIAPPADASPLRRAYFIACQGSEDAGADMPGERQIRRIIL